MLPQDPLPPLPQRHIEKVKVGATGVSIFVDAWSRLTCSSLLSFFQDASMRRQDARKRRKHAFEAMGALRL